MSELHELLAVEPDLKRQYDSIQAETVLMFTKQVEKFGGFSKTLTMFRDAKMEDQYLPSESREMVTTVHDRLAYTDNYAAQYLDACYQKECTNQRASADLVIGDQTLLHDVPATFLLGLETRLTKVRDYYKKIPTLQNGVEWAPDSARGDHVYVTAKPQHTYKTEKQVKHKVLYEATDKHPAQIEKWNENINIGVYESLVWCGMPTSAQKQRMIERLETLINAVKQARMRANKADVVKDKVAHVLFEYIHG